MLPQLHRKVQGVLMISLQNYEKKIFASYQNNIKMANQTFSCCNIA